MDKNEKVIRLDFYDENGNLKDKEQFDKEMNEIYNQLSNKNQCSCEEMSFIDMFIQDGDFVPQNVLDKY